MMLRHRSCLLVFVTVKHSSINTNKEHFMVYRSRQLSDKDQLKGLEKNLQRTNRHLLKKTIFRSGRFIVPVIWRGVEIVLAISVLFLLGLPVLFFLAVRKALNGKKILVKKVVTGKSGRPLGLNYFNLKWRPAAGLALLLSVVKGDLAFVGGSLVDHVPKELEPENNYLLSTKPGLFSLWNLRSACKIGHEGFKETEWEYCFTKNHISDLFIALRSIPTYFLKSSELQTPSSVAVFDIPFSNVTMLEAVDLIHEDLASGNEIRTIFFINADCLNKSYTDSSYSSILQNADYVLPDGIGINISCRMLGTTLKENVNGTDMLPFLCDMAVHKRYSIFLLGGLPGVAEKMADKIKTMFGVTIAGTHHGHFDHIERSDLVVDQVNKSGADILLVAFGSPLQEKWIAANKSKLQAGVALGVGGLFDFYSGNTKRSPRWFRELGLEWMYRMIQEPGRMWRRYIIGNPLFIYRVMVGRGKSKIVSRRVKQ